MTYNKPEVAVLGDAAEMIQSHNKTSQVTDNISSPPAYDLDE